MKLINKKFNIRSGKGIFTIFLKSHASEKGYTVSVQGLPEIITEGKTIIEAKVMAREAIELVLENKQVISSRGHEYHPYLKG